MALEFKCFGDFIENIIQTDKDVRRSRVEQKWTENNNRGTLFYVLKKKRDF